MVCDMNAVNRRAPNILLATANCPQFELNNKKNITIFDTHSTHLIKCFRSLFLKYDIECPINITFATGNQGKGKCYFLYITISSLCNKKAIWCGNILIMMYIFILIVSGVTKLGSHCQILWTVDNSYPNFVFAPLRVKLAVQVLSHTVAADMFAKIAQGNLVFSYPSKGLSSQMTEKEQFFPTYLPW